jgi:hypothetical protein
MLNQLEFMMDISALSNAASSMAQARTADAVGVAVFRKALDTAASSATELINSIPKPSSNPPHLGQSIDVSA